MPTNHDVWDAVAQSSGTPANSFEFLVSVVPGAGGAAVQSADVTNVNPAFTAKIRQRQTYAAKGVELGSKYADTLVLTFDVEAVRDANGLYQPFLQDLLNASKGIGAANKRTINAYDALGADYAFNASFAISASRSNTGWDDAGFYTITATQSGPTSWVANPVNVGNIPLINAVNPGSALASSTTTHVYIQGTGFTGVTGATGVKFNAVNATSYTVINDTLIDAVTPVTATGACPIIVTSPVGASAAYSGFIRT